MCFNRKSSADFEKIQHQLFYRQKNSLFNLGNSIFQTSYLKKMQSSIHIHLYLHTSSIH